jgi:hypothetical protein
MRRITLSSLLVFGILAAPLTLGLAQTLPDSTKPDTTTKPKKPPSKFAKIAKGVAGTAATAAAGAGVQSVLGKDAGGVANALSGAGALPCGTGYGVTAGAAIVGSVKNVVKKAGETEAAASATPCPQAGGLIPGLPGGIPGLPKGIPGLPGGIPGLPGGIPGLPSGKGIAGALAGAAIGGAVTNAAVNGAVANAAISGAISGANPLSGMGGAGGLVGMTPVGLAAGAAPGAIKGVKGLLGGKPQDKLAMVRELGKGKLELKSVKFIEGTLEFEPGFESSFTAFAEAVALVEGTYIMHVSAEQPRQKGAEPDTVLSHKRVAKVWALMAAAGVSDQKVFAMNELPAAVSEDRKLPKAGDVKVEIIKYTKP